MISIIYLLIRLKSSTAEVLPIYFGFIVVALVTFMFVVIMTLVGDPSAEDLLAKRILKVRQIKSLQACRSQNLEALLTFPLRFAGCTTASHRLAVVHPNRNSYIHVLE